MKNQIKYILLVVSILMYSSTYGQNNMEDVVYLKNGSIIRGIIIEQIPNQSIKIQTADRNVFVFKYDEIEKITKEYIPVANSNSTPKITDFKKSGFTTSLDINYGLGVGEVKIGNYNLKNDDQSFGFRFINGYQYSEHFSLGLGIGIEKYKNTSFLPITVNARMTFLKGKTSPVFTANIGYAVSLDNAKGGIIANPQIGINTYISKNVAYFFNVGYKILEQKVVYYKNNYYTLSNDNIYFQFMTVSSGFTF